MNTYTIALAGNPNVGKSTLFNALTGLHQHTGNWSGKTIDCACGSYTYRDTVFEIIDLPGTYSLAAASSDEQITADYLLSGTADVVIVLLDASALERTLYLALQIIDCRLNCVIGLNLSDEAAKNNIEIDETRLAYELQAPVIKLSALNKQGIDQLKEAVYNAAICPTTAPPCQIAANDCALTAYHSKASHIKELTQKSSTNRLTTQRLDDIFTSRLLGYPIMLGLLSLIFYLTIAGANIPSAMLSSLFTMGGIYLTDIMQQLSSPPWLTAFLINGIYQTTAWVVAVMLPPMAIFFPLFTILEDFGYLPRVAFNLDCLFKKCHACGKQAITSCIG